MALVFEDDTGRADAESYVSVAVFRAYCSARGRDATPYTDAVVEEKLREATQYIDGKWAYNAQVLVGTQALEFPRADLNDGNGRIFNTVPKRVKDACCEGAWLALTGTSLFAVLDHGGGVQSESVAGISVTYTPGSDAAQKFEAIANLVAPYARDPKKPLRMIPIFGTSDAPAFTQGQFDHPGAADGEV